MNKMSNVMNNGGGGVVPRTPTTPTSANNRHSENLTIWSHITSGLLQTWLNEKNSDKKLSIIELLMRNSKVDFIDNHEYNIVVYDNESEHSNQLNLNDSFALILLHKLAQKFKSVSFLIGGFVNFHTKHADLCLASQPPYSQIAHSPILTTSPSSDASSLTTTPVSSNPLSASVPDTSSLNKKYFIMCSNNNNNNNVSINEASVKCETEASATVKPAPKIHAPLTHSISHYEARGEASKFSLCLKSQPNAQMSHHGLSVSSFDTIASNCAVGFNLDSNKLSKPLSASVELPQPIRNPTKILNFLYLGSQEDALSQPTMNALNITYVLNVSVTCAKPEFIPDSHFLRIPVNDGHAAKLLPFFDVAYRFIEKCRKSNSKVIIHCLAGISRSPTLAIAYLMKHLSLKSDEAYRYVKERRQTISPNFNFLGQLYEYEKSQQRLLNTLKQDAQPQQAQKKPEKTSNFLVASSNSNTSKETCAFSSSSSDFTLFKLSRKLHSQPASPCISNEPASLNNSSQNLTADTSNKYSPSSIPRKKQFIFKFNDSTNENNSCLSSPQANKINNMCLTQSPSIYSLPSPSQAFSSFNLNSPTTANKAPQMIVDQSVVFRQMPKSFTLNLVSEFKADDGNVPNSDELMSRIRRPTNLLMSPMSPLVPKLANLINESKPQTPVVISSLKRPSSILLGACANPVISTTVASSASTSTASSISSTKSPSDLMMAKEKNFDSVSTSSSSSSTSTSSACSCCSTNSSTCSNCSLSMNLTQAHNMKKMKLSPIQDRCILKNFSATNLTGMKNFKFQPSSNTQKQAPPPPPPPITTTQSQLQSNTPSASISHQSLINTFRLNESRSYETLKSLAEQSFVGLKDFNRRRREANGGSSEEMILGCEDDENDENFMKKNDEDTASRLTLISSGLSLLSGGQVVSKAASSASSSSSPKNGSSKNSLHGSIETMIEVS